MYDVESKPHICIGLVIAIALLVVIGLTSWLARAAVSFADDYSIQSASTRSESADDPANSVITRTLHLPAVLKIPAGDWLTVWADEFRAPVMRELAALSRREYGVEVAVWQIEDMQEAIMNAHLVGSGPDIFVGPHDRLGGWLEAGIVVPIELGARRDEFVPMSLSSFTSAGQLYGLPYAFENMGLFRNVDLVEDAPLTWTELLTTGQALKASGQVSYSLALEDNGYKVYPIVTTFGGYVFGRDSQGTWMTDDLGIAGSGMISAGNWISDAVGAGYIPSMAHDGDGAQTLFENSHVPYIMTGPWALERFRASYVNYAISAFPDGGQPFAGVLGFMINGNSDKQELAEDFLTEFVATAEIMEMLYEHENRPPAYKPLEATVGDPDLAAFYALGQGAQPMPAVPEMGCVWSPWRPAGCSR